jgi:hypothetical protein
LRFAPAFGQAVAKRKPEREYPLLITLLCWLTRYWADRTEPPKLLGLLGALRPAH